MDLQTNAEERADKTRTLPGFKNFSLPGVKEQVAAILNLIGRAEGIFSTYTAHDISHINAMLRMLDWLVPQSTAKIMTSADWLMIVLAIYLHDLGMVVTAEEYEQRNENEDFRAWFESLDKTNEGREYLARTKRMTETERERFFFQEFVRMGHAARIKEWITGRHSRNWGEQVKPISDAVAKLLDPLPTRFREYLAVVCESHHKDNLDKTDTLYPLFARVGSDPQESVNVQYSAILLRTTDLLHVTKDRTPSVMYKTLKLSDPKAVSEWDKQLGAFAVGPKGRELIEGDSTTAIIVINADFTEERPLFALQEYITYANNQATQSKRWAEKSQEQTDARDYSFPWHTVTGDVRLEGVPPQPLRFELDRGRLLDLLVGHTIYNDPTVAVRELLQNGIDAVRFQHHLEAREARTNNDPEPDMGTVTVRWNPGDKLLVVEDDGVGMDRDVIEYHLMSVGASFYDTPQFEHEHRDFSPISRFGIGILTCFMVSDDIEIITLKGDKGHRIRMTSVHADYLLRELPPDDPILQGIESHGTRVKLRLRDTIDVSERTIRDIVRHWIILPECTVQYHEVGKEPEPLGFDSPADALRHYHGIENKVQADSWEKLEVITKSRAASDNTGHYELAFTVKSGYTPERGFAHRPYTDLPAVCIEGIRVADSLPWFSSNLSAFLSVRGDRSFRTTVSRAGLEIDEEFHRVGKLCTDMLFEHLHDEISRISDKPGNPLSQASTASRWLFSTLIGSSSTVRAHEYLRELLNRLPSMVIERVDTHDGKIDTRRTLISRLDFSEEREFWTVESRLLDSLGIISRDLGRELSLNEFLVTLAPDYTDLQYSPLLLDAHLFSEMVLRSHRPASVQFSRQHQQSAIKWRPLENLDDTARIDLDHLLSQDLYQQISFMLELETHRWIRAGSMDFTDIEVAEIVGDDNEVDVVVSRIGTVFRPESNVARLWLSLRGALMQIANNSQNPDQVIAIIKVTSVFIESLKQGRVGRFELEKFDSNWNQVFHTAKAVLEELQLTNFLPEDLHEFVNNTSIFNASTYWRDWSS